MPQSRPAQLTSIRLEDLRLDRSHPARSSARRRSAAPGCTGQRHRDHHALPHTARDSWCGYASIRAAADRGCTTFSSILIACLRRSSAFFDRSQVDTRNTSAISCETHLQERIQRRHRVLEDHADPPAADGPQLAPGRAEQVHLRKPHRPRVDLRRTRWQEPEDGHHRHALAAAALAHQGQDLTPPDRQGIRRRAPAGVRHRGRRQSTGRRP